MNVPAGTAPEHSVPGGARNVPPPTLRERIPLDRLRLPLQLSVQLDAVRAIAASLVMLGHVRGLFFVSYGNVRASLHASPLVRVVYAYTSVGHQAVMVFFVLSGFFISGSILKALAQNRWSWRWYLIQRLTRLWIVLLPALLLGAVWDQAGMHLLSAHAVYHGQSGDSNILPASVPARSNPGVMLGNLFYLQTILVPTFGTNGPLWSLANELWYYMLFPCLALIALSGSRRTALVAVGAAGVIALFVGVSITLYFAIWLLGVAGLLLPRINIAGFRLGLPVRALCWAVFALILAASRAVHQATLSDFAVGIGFALVLYGFVCVGTSPAPEDRARAEDRSGIAATFAGFSYTLYLVHLPLLVFVHAWLYSRGVSRWQPDTLHLALAAGMVTGVLIYAWVVSRLTEAHTNSVRRWVDSLLIRPRPAATAASRIP